MTLAIRAEVLRAAVEDADTRIKLNLAATWEDCIAILVEFAKRKGLRVVKL
jgi:hypothetical protein